MQQAINVLPRGNPITGGRHNVPGWNDYVRDKHDSARNAYRDWLIAGKPKFGYIFKMQ